MSPNVQANSRSLARGRMVARWYDAINDKEKSLSLFDHAMRFTALRRQVTATLIGALELVAYDPTINFMSSFARTPSRT